MKAEIKVTIEITTDRSTASWIQDRFSDMMENEGISSFNYSKKISLTPIGEQVK